MTIPIEYAHTLYILYIKRKQWLLTLLPFIITSSSSCSVHICLQGVGSKYTFLLKTLFDDNHRCSHLNSIRIKTKILPTTKIFFINFIITMIVGWLEWMHGWRDWDEINTNHKSIIDHIISMH